MGFLGFTGLFNYYYYPQCGLSSFPLLIYFTYFFFKGCNFAPGTYFTYQQKLGSSLDTSIPTWRCGPLPLSIIKSGLMVHMRFIRDNNIFGHYVRTHWTYCFISLWQIQHRYFFEERSGFLKKTFLVFS